MKLRIFLPLAFPILLASGAATGCESSATEPGHCTRPDVNTPCTQPDAAVRDGATGWKATIHITTTQAIEYKDAGFVCSYRSTRCATEYVCFFSGVPTWSAANAIAVCRSRALEALA